MIGRLLGTSLQERVPNCFPLLQTKAMVVSREEKGPARLGQVTCEKKNESESPFLMSKSIRTISKPRFVVSIQNTRKIRAIVSAGRLLDRQNLDEMLKDIERPAKASNGTPTGR